MEREGYQPEGAPEKITEIEETLENGTEVLELKPEHPKSEVPTVWANAFGTNVETYRPLLEALAERGRDVIAFTHPREGVTPARHKEMLPGSERENALPPTEMRRALDLLEVINAKKVPKVDIVGNSLGSATAVITALGAPERVRSIVLLDPIGLVGKHSVPELIARYGREQLGTSSRALVERGDALKNYTRYIAEGFREAFRNPGLTIEEIKDTPETDLTPMLKELHDQGIKISIIHTTDDEMFPMEKMQQMVKAKDIDGFVSARGQHEEAIIFQPERFMAATDELLSAMERKSEREARGSDREDEEV